MLMVTFISHSPEQTQELGRTLGSRARAGEVFAVSGDLGAGKTQLVKGFARGLDIAGNIHSPTFSLVNIHHGGRLPLYHLDLYRLEKPDEIVQAGLHEYMDTDGVVVIEWAERWFGDLHASTHLPGNVRRILISETAALSRTIQYDESGH